MKIIGILSDFGNKKYGSELLNLEFYQMRPTYVDWLERCDIKNNIMIFILPYSYEKIQQYCYKIDGLLITGGDDVDPKFYNEEILFDNLKTNTTRFEFELKFIKHFLKTKKPILGICAGMQSINVALEGSLYQDIEKQIPESKIKHVDLTNVSDKSNSINFAGHSHGIKIIENTLTYDIFQNSEISINSLHHQSIKKLGKDLIATSFAEDGVIESIEIDQKNHPFCVGVQWHPELLDKSEASSKALFTKFISSL
jgi:putative glutamine amidotransferase